MTNDRADRPTQDPLETLFYHTDRVRLVHWERFSGARFAIILVGIIAVFSFISGLSTLTQPEIVLRGPVGRYIPGIEPAVRFGGILSAFILTLVTLGLHRRKRLALWTALLMLPVLTLIPLATLGSTEIPLLVLIAIGFVLLLTNRAQFTNTLDLSSLQISSLGAIAGVLTYGIVGSYMLRDQFIELETWSDAVYYVIVTIATVGYGDITPITTEAQWFSLSVIIFGTGSFTVAIGSLIVPAIEKRMANAVGNIKPSEMTLLEDHVIILGYSDITESLLAHLEEESDLVVVTSNAEQASQLDDRDINVITADPADASALRDAGIEYASGVVVGTRDDAQDVLAVLAVREINEDVTVVAAANEAKNASKLKSVGANDVVSPSEIGGVLLSRSMLEDVSIRELIERIEQKDSGTGASED